MGADFNDFSQGRDDAELQRVVDGAPTWAPGDAPGAPNGQGDAGSDDSPPEPLDLFAVVEPPALPGKLLPKAIEDFAHMQGELMGADPAGLAMAALTTCAAALTDDVRLQPKVHDYEWTESARLWAALIGEPSTKKSPTLRTAARPLAKADARMFHAWQRQMAEYQALPKDERASQPRPLQKRKRIEDVTIEAAQDVLQDNPEGLLCLQDELSGWFGAMDAYRTGKGAMKDRGFWLQTFNGGPYALNRVGRGSVFLPNASVCLLGGIQPEPIRRVARESLDDGLLQRMFPVVLQEADVGQDRPPARDVVDEYRQLIEGLIERRAVERSTPWGDAEPAPLHFDEEAQTIRRRLEHVHLELVKLDCFNRKLGAHFGKYDGLFARLCLLFHAIEHAHADGLPMTIGADVAERVEHFLHRFLRPHALAFYHGTLTVHDAHDQLTAVAGYIIAHGCLKLTARDVQRGDATMRTMDKLDVKSVMDKLEVAGWVEPDHYRADSLRWKVNPLVHERFARQAETERQKRASGYHRLRENAATEIAS